MGTGCSSVENLRLSINQKDSPEMTLPPEEGSDERREFEAKSVDDDVTVSNGEEEDELDSLSPISGITKIGSARRRGLSATSTLLPGTSISLSPVTEEMSELDMCKPLPDLEEFPEDIRNLLLGRCTMQETIRNLPLMEVSLIVLTNGPDTLELLDELRRTTIPKLEELCNDHDSMLNVYEFGHQALPHGSEVREVLKSTVKDLQITGRYLILVLCGERLMDLDPPDTILAPDFDRAVSRMHSADTRELFHCCYRVDENSVPPRYRLPRSRTAHEDWDSQAREMVEVLDAVMEEEAKERYLTTGWGLSQHPLYEKA